MTLAEQERDLATLRVLGFGRREASYVLLAELGGAMLGLQSVGKRVPEDVSIVGVDDSLVDIVPRLNLPTMKLRFDDIGATAFSMVRRQCEGEKIPVGVKTVIPPELIERGSVLDIS